MNNRASNQGDQGPIFPLIQGILSFDTPYNGLARSMFVYGAFSNYSKVSNVFNVMTALSAVAPASISRLTTRRAAAGSVAASSGSSSNPAWTAWQLVAVRTGTVGAIAAGGVAAYTHREAILRGMRSVKNLNRDSVAEGYRQGMGALGQGLAYINRGNVGRSFAWLSDHFTFVGALMRQAELNRRLERLGVLKGVGIHDFYCSLGENGYWSGGYFVPERTFCAVPADDHAANPLFSRCVIEGAGDEVEAHLSIFQPEKNGRYQEMTEEAGKLVIAWFLSDADVVDDPKFREPPPDEIAENSAISEVLEKGGAEIPPSAVPEDGDTAASKKELPDESPIDIAAAASLVPLPDDTQGELLGDTSIGLADSDEKKTYMNHLFQVAQQAGTGIKGFWPPNMPNMPNMPNIPNMPNMPNMPPMPSMPASMSSIGQVSMPSVNIFSKKQPPAAEPATGEIETEKETVTGTQPI